MAILNAHGLSQSFGDFDLFSGLTASIPNDGRVGLVGPNGIGKTTLLLILAGINRPSTGTVHWARGSRIGYLPQESAEAFNGRAHTVFDEMLTIFADLRRVEEKLRRLESDMAAGNDSEELLAEYSGALEQFELDGGYEYETRIKQVLQGLGFSQADWQLPLPHLSGGQKTRALLARLLLEMPDLLILDEPTNHLDVAAIEWLEGALRVWGGALLIVSHDRYFLDKVVNVIWEMGRAGIETYRGSYSAYVQQRQARWELRLQEFETEKARLEKELDYIKRNIAGQRVQMAKGKLSRISRELTAIHQLGFDGARGKSWSELSGELGPDARSTRHSMSVAEAAEAIKNLPRPSGRHKTLNIRLQSDLRSGNIVLRAQELAVGYPGNTLFTAAEIELRRLECAALIGPNGSGKTTFLKTLLDQLPPLAGKLEPGASLKIGYFAQAHEQLDPAKTVLAELTSHHEMFVSEARDYLAKFLLQGDDVFKLVSSLSGGERGRLALAILALEGANFLLLDEPTNHLDIPAQETLQEVLEQFEGTILLVSHDRYLVDRLATQIWELTDGRLVVFPGPYQEYLAEREKVAQLEAVPVASKRSNGRQPTATLSNNALQKRAVQLAELEDQISHLEQQLAELSDALQIASAGQPFDKIQALSIEYAAVEQQLEQSVAAWEKMVHEQTRA